jgi:hypothetical protein
MAKPFLIELYVQRTAGLDAIERVKKIPGFIAYDLPSLRQHKPNGSADESEQRAARGPYKKYDMQGDEALIKILFGKPPMTNGQLKTAFSEMGRAPASINSLIHIMLKRGDLQRTDDGYTLTRKVKDKIRHQLAARKKRI